MDFVDRCKNHRRETRQAELVIMAAVNAAAALAIGAFIAICVTQ